MDIKMPKNAFFGVLAACVAAICLGIFGLVQQYSWIEGATSITMYIPWGLYITLFLTLEAIGAGALLFAALAKNASRVARIRLSVAGVVCAACSGLSIMPDLGNPLTSWRLFFAPNVASPLMLDVWLMCLTLVFGVLLFVGLRFSKPGLEKAGMIGSIMFACLFVIGTAVMFCSLPGKIGWESTSEMGVALAQMVAAGAAMAMILKAKAEGCDCMPKVAIAALLVVAVFTLAEAMLLVYRADFALEAFKQVIFGVYAPIFWVGIIVGVVAPVVCFATSQNLIGAICVLVGLLFSKLAFVVRGSVYPTYTEMASNVNIPLLAPMQNGAQTVVPYAPTMNEYFVAAAIIGIVVGLIVFVLNTRLVPNED